MPIENPKDAGSIPATSTALVGSATWARNPEESGSLAFVFPAPPPQERVVRHHALVLDEVVCGSKDVQHAPIGGSADRHQPAGEGLWLPGTDLGRHGDPDPPKVIGDRRSDSRQVFEPVQAQLLQRPAPSLPTGAARKLGSSVIPRFERPGMLTVVTRIPSPAPGTPPCSCHPAWRRRANGRHRRGSISRPLRDHERLRD